MMLACKLPWLPPPKAAMWVDVVAAKPTIGGKIDTNHENVSRACYAS